MAVPATRDVASPRPYTEILPEPVYAADDVVCRVHQHGAIWFQKRMVQIGEALAGQAVGVQPTDVDGVHLVRYGQRQMAIIDLREEH